MVVNIVYDQLRWSQICFDSGEQSVDRFCVCCIVCVLLCFDFIFEFEKYFFVLVFCCKCYFYFFMGEEVCVVGIYVGFFVDDECDVFC